MIGIRRAAPEDVAGAAQVYLRSRRASVPAVPPLVHDDDDDVRRWFAEEVFSRRQLWVAHDDVDGIVGVMVLDGDWLDQLYVAPSHTGRGVGTRLLEVARSERPAGLQLWAFASNLGARRFYERHGFVAVEETDGTGNEEKSPDVRYLWRPT
ncbi:MAG TPA: GNAT family N-acetyltransferase [Acidimicrobiales bacterium]|nr:GNAT family N-acetyltransferase [Acidimicrobiales bacterium]